MTEDTPGPGHNSVVGGELKAFVERIERLEDEKQATADDIKGVYAEAKSTGFDVKAMRTIIRLRQMEEDTVREQNAVLDIYYRALGMTFML